MNVLDVMTAPWALVPEKFGEVREVYLRHVRGERLSFDQLEEFRAARAAPVKAPTAEPYQNVNGVAIIPVDGVIGKKMNLFMDISGGTSTQLLGQAVQQALNDPAVRAVVLAIDSPGGSVDGTQDVARKIFASRGQKPIVAYSDGMMASAAYWIGAAADRIYISGDTVEVGSIGVVASHTDVSKLEETQGVKTTEIVAGKFKRVASAYAPLSDIGRATIQEQVDHVYSIFVQDVATFRGVSPETVVKDMADGRIFMGQQAIDRGLVDAKRSLDSLVSELSTGSLTGGRRMSGTAAAPVSVISQESFDTAVSEAREAGQKTGYESGRAEGVRLGAEQERQRIKDVQAQYLPGHQALVQTLMFDGKTSGPEAAVQVLDAERKGKQGKLDEFFADAPPPVPPSVPTHEAPTTDEAKRNKLIKDIEARDSCSYQDAARAAAKEQPELFKRR